MTSPGKLLHRFERGLSREIPHALKGESEGIHGLRVTSRRLRLALGILPKRTDGRQVRSMRSTLRAVISVAGHIRDLDAGVQILEAHLDDMIDASSEARLLLKRMKASRHRNGVYTHEALLDIGFARLLKDLRRLLADGVVDAATAGRRIHELAGTSHMELLDGLIGLGRQYDPELLHALRRRIRRLRYLADLTHDLFDMDGKDAKHYGRMQEELGILHDQHVLAIWFSKRASLAKTQRNAALMQEAKRLEKWAAMQARARHREWLDTVPIERLAAAFAWGFSVPPPAPSATC